MFKSITSSLSNFIYRHAKIILPALVTVSVAVLYLSVATSKLTIANYGADGGDFLAAILTGGIPHPTGYPTYTLLGILFQYIPIGTPVFRGVVVSLVPAALGAGLLTAWMAYVIDAKPAIRWVAGAVSGLAWAIAPLLFSQAVIVEVHGLQTLIGVLALWWMAVNLKPRDRTNKTWVLGLAFLFGIGCGNHLTILLIAPAALFALIYSTYRDKTWKLAIAQILLVMMGWLVYLYLPLRAQSFPPINWGNPQSWQGFVWEITGNPYRGLVFGATTPMLWERIRSVGSLILDQYGAIGLVAGVIGAIQYPFKIKGLRWLLVWIFLVTLAFAIGYNTQDSVGYLLPAMMVFAIWIGLAIPSVWQLGWKRIPIGAVAVIVLVVSIGARIPGTRVRVDARSQDQPARYVEKFLKEAPENAIVYTRSDQDSFPLWYYHFGLRERSDLRIVVLPLTQFVWYQQTLVHTYPDLKFPSISTKDTAGASWGSEIQNLNPKRPVCNTRASSDSENGVAFQCNNQ